MKELTQEQFNRLMATAEIVDKGPGAILQKLYEFTDYLSTFAGKLDTNTADIEAIKNEFDEIKTLCNSCMSMIATNDTNTNSKLADLSLNINNQLKDINAKFETISSQIKAIPSYTSDITDLKSKVDDQTDRLKIAELTQKVEDLTALLKISPQQNARTGNGYNFFGAVRTRYVDDETPQGVIDGNNTVFTLRKSPATGSLKLYRGGARQRVTEDYTLSGYTITFVIAPEVGEILLADYRI